MTTTDYSRLKRPRHPIPQFVMEALVTTKLRSAYFERPAYQQNDYIGWITQARQEKTKQKRLLQMLDELKGGRLYMKMKYQPKVESLDGLRSISKQKNKKKGA